MTQVSSSTTRSLSNPLSKISVCEEMSLADAYESEAKSRISEEIKAGRTAPISNERIRMNEKILGTYVVTSEAISGGMGSVWRVHHKDWDIDLAMKRPQPRFFAEGSEKRKKAFVEECQNWISLALHPCVVSCYYVREIGGVPTIFSEWMENGSLRDRIRDDSLYIGTTTELQAVPASLQDCRVPLPDDLKDLLVRCVVDNGEDASEASVHDFSNVIPALEEIFRAITNKEYARLSYAVKTETADLLNNYALSFLDLKQKEVAEKLWEEALRIDPNHNDSLFNKALYEFRTGRKSRNEILSEISNKRYSYKDDYEEMLRETLAADYPENSDAQRLDVGGDDPAARRGVPVRAEGGRDLDPDSEEQIACAGVLP